MSEPARSCVSTCSSSTPAPASCGSHGDRVKLPPQPFKVLELLVRRSGEVVTRAEIREHVWCGDTFVDFEQGLNFCIRQIREALGDTAERRGSSRRCRGAATVFFTPSKRRRRRSRGPSPA